MNWTIRLVEHARKQIKRIPPRDCFIILAALSRMKDNPFTGNVKHLYNEHSAYRRRTGNWRIFFDTYPKTNVVVVVSIERRTTTTYRKR